MRKIAYDCPFLEWNQNKEIRNAKGFRAFLGGFQPFFFLSFWFWSTGVLVFNWAISLWISIVWENVCPSHVSSPTLGFLDGFPISLLGVMLLFSNVGFPFSSLFGASLQYESYIDQGYFGFLMSWCLV